MRTIETVTGLTRSKWSGAPAALGRRLPPVAVASSLRVTTAQRAGRVLGGPLVLCVFGAAAIAGLVLLARLGDYPTDAGQAVAALAAGSFGRAAAVPFLMGPFSIVLRAPFAWVANHFGAGELGVYRAGIVPCLAAAVGLGLVLARRSLREGQSRSWPLVVPMLAILSPASLAAVQNGHPEEALGGALCVGAVLLAAGRRPGAAGLVLGLALATKQWALVAAAPALLATVPQARARLAVVAALTAALFYVPFVARDPHAFMTATRVEARVVSASVPETVWLAASHERQIRVDGLPVLTYRATAKWIPPLSHSLIIALAGLVGLALWRRPLSAAQALAVLALVFLLRCVLDPVNQDYFQLPFLLALLAWEVVAGRVTRNLPIATLSMALCLWVTFGLLHGNVSIWLVNTVYLAWTSAIALHLLAARGGGSVFGRQVPGSRPTTVAPSL